MKSNNWHCQNVLSINLVSSAIITIHPDKWLLEIIKGNIYL